MAKSTILDPVGDRIVIRKDEERTKTKGGIILPDNSKIPTITGRVVAISPKVAINSDYENVKDYVKVLVDPRNAIPVDFENDNKLYVIPIEDVVAVFGQAKEQDEQEVQNKTIIGDEFV